MKSKNRTAMTPELQQRISRVKKKARDYLTKTEIVQFRLDAETYAALFSLAEKHRKPAGTLVREWVSDRISRDMAATAGSATSALQPSEHELLLSLQKDVEKLKQLIHKRR